MNQHHREPIMVIVDCENNKTTKNALKSGDVEQ